MIKSDTGIKKAALQKEEQLYTYLIYLQALFYRNLINTILMTATVKFGREELCQNHIRFFSADEASRHNQYISVITNHWHQTPYKQNLLFPILFEKDRKYHSPGATSVHYSLQ